MMKKNRTLFLSLALCASISYAEDDGGFFTVGYQLGQVMQDVQNPGGTKRDELARELNADVTNNILNNNTGGNVAGALSNAFSQYLYSLLGAYPEKFNSSDVSANALLGGAVGSGTCAAAGTAGSNSLNTQSACTAAGYYWLPSLSNRVLSTIGSQTNYGTDTNFPNMQQQLTYLNAANVFFNAMNKALETKNDSDATGQNGQAYSQQAIQYLQNQQNILNNAANLLKQDELLLEAFNSAVAANIGNKEFNSAVFTGLVQGIIDQSQSVYNELNTNPISGSAFNNATNSQLTNQANVVQGRANQLSNALYNAQVTLDKINALNNQVKSMPYLPQFRAGNSRSTNILNGFYTKVGYKQFFGKKRNIGLRYYGFFSYNGASVGFRSTQNNVGLYTYGVGTDVLYNIFSRSYQNRSVDMGFFSGIQLAGETFQSTLRDDPNVKLHGKVNNTHFQFLFDFGMRMNFGKLDGKSNRHNQHTVEFGVVVPTIYNTYYKSAGTTVKYFRPYSVYWSYGYSF
ncbi:membrane protein [Helicobacter pylori]|uniref:outer membrane protein n=1 Tax=Helicobacter pylori TaxID=210 RepID=UPI001AA9EEA7|nr:outer membrane protein [Helicobacter pylori]GHS33121.1 membrane protein [Helicobacter pylori]